ncbi:hypothetical protein WJX84_002416 [Apatococcus fuscideae]|uniref:DUF7781 domain-containing protein n=1 Tax=Apatococcus fuscideae TaxID=2026836 RepID=A0AAW1SQ41_9CHLO
MSDSDLQEFEGDYSSYSESASEEDFLADLLERYTCTFRPEYCLKLRKSTKPFLLGLNCSRWRKANHFCAVLKPNQDSWLRKVTLSSQERRLEVSTKKFHFGQDVLTFSAVAGLDIERLKPSLGWKFSTRWSLGTYKIGRKEKFSLGPAAEFRPRWKLDYSAPEIEGAVGGEEDQAVQVYRYVR